LIAGQRIQKKNGVGSTKLGGGESKHNALNGNIGKAKPFKKTGEGGKTTASPSQDQRGNIAAPGDGKREKKRLFRYVGFRIPSGFPESPCGRK